MWSAPCAVPPGGSDDLTGAQLPPAVHVNGPSGCPPLPLSYCPVVRLCLSPDTSLLLRGGHLLRKWSQYVPNAQGCFIKPFIVVMSSLSISFRPVFSSLGQRRLLFSHLTENMGECFTSFSPCLHSPLANACCFSFPSAQTSFTIHFFLSNILSWPNTFITSFS